MMGRISWQSKLWIQVIWIQTLLFLKFTVSNWFVSFPDRITHIYTKKILIIHSQASERLSTKNEQMYIKKCFIFCYVFASLTSNISATRQNFKNLVGNIWDIKMRNFIAKFKLSSFNTEGAFQVTDRQTSKNNLTLVLLLL